MRLTAIGTGLFFAMAAFLLNSPSLQAQSQNTITVNRGDTLSEIAVQNGTTVQQLANANASVTDPDLIYAGQQLHVPRGSQSTTRSTSTSVNRSTSQRPAATQTRATSQNTAPASSGVWDRLAQCESGGDWSINTGNGFYGGLQFTLSSWRAVGGSGYPHHASKSEQIERAKKLRSIQGWGAWPACTSKLGIR